MQRHDRLKTGHSYRQQSDGPEKSLSSLDKDMELRHQRIVKFLAGVCLVSIVAYIFIPSNRSVEWKKTKNKYSWLETIKDVEAAVVRTYAVHDGVKPCPCENRTFHSPEAPQGVHSLCGEGATARGNNQRLVSYNFYGPLKSARPYFEGIRVNAALLPRAYPGWTMRVYHGLPAGHAALCELSCEFPHLDFCDVKRIPGFGDVSKWQMNAWRFFAIGDPLVDVAMFRDLDSEFIERELVAVDQWLNSDLTFHVMRDTPYHARVPVLAGMWGARVHQRRTQLRFHLPLLTNVSYTNKENDQFKLKDHLWPIMKGDVMQHDSYGCVKYSSFGNVYPFVTRRNETDVLNWIGVRKGRDTKPLLFKCPEVCRPPANKNWTYC